MSKEYKSWEYMDSEEKVCVILSDFAERVMGNTMEVSPESEEVKETAQQILNIFS